MSNWVAIQQTPPHGISAQGKATKTAPAVALPPPPGMRQPSQTEQAPAAHGSTPTQVKLEKNIAPPDESNKGTDTASSCGGKRKGNTSTEEQQTTPKRARSFESKHDVTQTPSSVAPTASSNTTVVVAAVPATTAVQTPSVQASLAMQLALQEPTRADAGPARPSSAVVAEGRAVVQPAPLAVLQGGPPLVAVHRQQLVPMTMMPNQLQHQQQQLFSQSPPVVQILPAQYSQMWEVAQPRWMSQAQPLAYPIPTQTTPQQQQEFAIVNEFVMQTSRPGIAEELLLARSKWGQLMQQLRQEQQQHQATIESQKTQFNILTARLATAEQAKWALEAKLTTTEANLVRTREYLADILGQTLKNKTDAALRLLKGRLNEAVQAFDAEGNRRGVNLNLAT